jgi:formylglycine-generating enzyme required for sulfatase activity
MMNYRAVLLAVLAGALMGCASASLHQSSHAGPELIALEGGEFLLGSPAEHAGHQEDEGPQVRVAVPRFALSRFEVTVAQYRRFVEETGHASEFGCIVMSDSGVWEYDPSAGWQQPGFAQSDDHPVTCVSWLDAQAYVSWLNARHPGFAFRLPSEAEWAFAAKAGGTAVYWWGETEADFCGYANGADALSRAVFPSWERTGACEDGFVYTAPVGHYAKPNAFGLEDMAGNVWEWVQDCYTDTHADNPKDGTALDKEPCGKRVMRGGAWGDYGAFYLRTAYRGAWDGSQAFANLGFRVAADRAR